MSTHQDPHGRDPRREDLELRLAEGGAQALVCDDELRAWVESDDEAVALLEAFVLLDQTFESMTSGETADGEDAPDELVAALLARPELAEPVTARTPAAHAGRPGSRRRLSRLLGSWRKPGWRAGLAAAALVIVALAIGILMPGFPANQVPLQPMGSFDSDDRVAPEQRKKESRTELKALGYLGAGSAGVDSSSEGRAVGDQLPESQPPAVHRQIDAPRRRRDESSVQALEPLRSPAAPPPQELATEVDEFRFNDEIHEEIIVAENMPVLEAGKLGVGSEVPAFDFETIPTAPDPGAIAGRTAGTKFDRFSIGDTDLNSSDLSDKKKEARLGKDFALRGALRKGEGDTVSSSDILGHRVAELGEAAEFEADGLVRGDPAKVEAARRYLDERRRVDGLTFLDAAGYWRNPWVPGDPDLRFLAARLDDLAPRLPAGLHRLARRPRLPFDPPENDALALYLHADRTVVDGPSRIAVRVGVRAADAWAGRRTAMNLAVVLHLPPAEQEIPAQTAASLRALIEALGEAHDLGDRFHLFVAGRPGGLLVAPDDFRRGALLVAARQLLDPPVDVNSATPQTEDLDDTDDRFYGIEETTDLTSILLYANDAVRAVDDPDSPVGSSAVLVVTLGDDVEAIENAVSTAHSMAVGGVRVSALGVGAEIGAGDTPNLLARLADAGQGSRRLVTRPADATGAIDDELAQAARAVARAVRLRIRPAPGVQLVGVFDSQPLGAPAAERVRQAEQALDRRLAHKLGIEADRGDDEEGIQIVVPALYAGDAMTLLVDLVAPGPGPLVDVTVRYKDLVRVENGVARARLDLAYGEPPEVPASPLEVSVVVSLLAHEVKGCLEQAARDLESGSGEQASTAVATLSFCRDLLRGMARRLPALADDPDLARDLAMLDGYVAALQAAPEAETLAAVVQSLLYAGKLKTLPPPRQTPPVSATAEDGPR